MNSLETLYLPDTIIYSERQYPLFLLFDKVKLVKTADDPANKNEGSEESFIYGDFCQEHTLHPLGEDKDRFLYLINDIKNRKDDYAAQLGHLTLASFSHDTKKGEDTKHQIMSTLLGRPGAEANKEKDLEQDRIWHARLVLKIAEILDKEQEDVAKAFMMLEDSETGLFDKLKGGNEDDEADSLYNDLLKLKSKIDTPSSGSVRNRLKAWFRFIGDEKLPECPVWVTSREEVAAVFIENHNRLHDRLPNCIAEISMPVHIGGSTEKDFNKFEDFCRSGKAVKEVFSTMLVTGVPQDRPTDKVQQKVTDWNSLLESFYPEPQYGRSILKLYQFSGPLPMYSGAKEFEHTPGPDFLALLTS